MQSFLFSLQGAHWGKPPVRIAVLHVREFRRASVPRLSWAIEKPSTGPSKAPDRRRQDSLWRGVDDAVTVAPRAGIRA